MGLTNQKACCECPCRVAAQRCQEKPVRTRLKGMEYLREPKAYKGLTLTKRERDCLGIRGLLPAAVRAPQVQVQGVLQNLSRFEDDLSQYIFLRELQDTNERLFYRTLCEHTEELMPIVYTPTVGKACINYSLIFMRPRGLYISLHDAGKIYEILGNWTEKEIKAIVVTDGERILGLGDLGANGMGIPVGKMALYTAIGGVPPSQTLPVTIDVGTNNEKLLSDPLYVGLRQKRAKGPEYDDLIEEFMEAVVRRYGRSCLIQFEDFGNYNAFRLLSKYKQHYCTFNDDIQGTASVAVAGIIASTKITGVRMTQNRFLFMGAGEAALGTADLLVMAMEQEGISRQEATSHIWMMDSKGLIVKDRAAKDTTIHKAIYAKEEEPEKDLLEVIKRVQPTVLIGVSAQHGVFTEEILRLMASINEKPVIFALSNPTHKAECTAEQAYTHTEGRCVFASGSPFPPFTLNEKKFYPGQGNNAYIFPGVAFGVIASGVYHIPEEVFLIAAKALAEQVTKEDIEEGRVYPPLSKVREVSVGIAAKVSQYFYVEGLATYRPEPEDKAAFLRGLQYDYDYGELLHRSSNGYMNGIFRH